MTQSHKQLERKLKGPDQFQKVAAQSLNWLANNPTYVWAAVGPILLVAAGWMGWGYWSKHNTTQRQEELGTVESVYQEELKIVADKAEALRKQQDEIDVKLTKETDPKNKEEMTAQRKAFETQANALKPDHTGSLNGYVSYFSKYPNRPEGWAAGMRAAAINVQKKEYATAKDTLLEVADQSKSEKFYQVQAKFMLIGIYEELGDAQSALTEVTALESKVDDRVKPQVLLTKARLQLTLEQKEEASKTITNLLEKFASSQEADKARSIKALYIGG